MTMLIAFTGAGISAPSGIPTFADQPGIRDKLTRDFADRHPAEFRNTLNGMLKTCIEAEPNDAHLALAEYGVPVVTMNVDGLHKRAGSKRKAVLEIHGSLYDGNVVLYGDPAPLYQDAMDWISRLGPDDVLLIAGTSYYTDIARRVLKTATRHGVGLVEIDHDAETLVRLALEKNKAAIEPLDAFLARTDEAAYDDAPPVPPPYSGGWQID